MAWLLVGKDRVAMQVEGRELRLSHLDRGLFPAAGFTKAHLIDYYARAPRRTRKSRSAY